MKQNLIGLDRRQLELWLATLGEKPYRARQIMRWVHQRGTDAFQSMTDLSKPLRKRLDESATLTAPGVSTEQQSSDGTRKWLVRLADGNCVEMVFIPEPGRGTLCVSSQVGCILNCTFCATAQQGYNRNLSSDEIIAQLWLANRRLGVDEREHSRITNVVFMGMGEPLLNYENVVHAVSVMRDDLAYGLSKRRVTVSTAGVVPAIDRLRAECDVSLAVSLHATNDSLRNQLVPINRKYPLKDLLAACRRYVEGAPRRKVTFEYVMLADVNDSPAEARQLASLLNGVPAKINLIPFNSFPGTSYRSSEAPRIEQFREILLGRGIMSVTRKTRGGDIAAACGQLAGDIRDRTRRSARRAVG